jgi:phage-related protein
MPPLPIVLSVRFYRTEAGNEPVKDWLKSLPAHERRTIGEDVRTVQIGWPLGMPLVRKMTKHLWEIRIHLDHRIARLFFTVIDAHMVLLHGIIKTSQKTPQDDLDLATARMKLTRGELS